MIDPENVENIKGIMDDITSGDAFNRGLEDIVSSASTGLAGIDIPSFPNIHGLESIGSDLAGFTTDITGVVSGPLQSFSGHISDAFDNIGTNLNIYAAAQSLEDALNGTGSGCSKLNDFFGTITEEGNNLMSTITETTYQIDSAIQEFKQLKAQIQSEISNLDNNIIPLLTGQVSNTILGNLTNKVGLNVMGHLEDLADQGQVSHELVDMIRDQLDFTNFNSLANLLTGRTSSIKNVVLGLVQNGGALQALIDKETESKNGATEKLQTLGQANMYKNLFKKNGCAQTILGFVAQTDFLNKLGI